MKLKEKQIPKMMVRTDDIVTKDVSESFDGGIFTTMLIAFLIGSARVGGSSAPLCVSFMSVLSPIQSVAAFAGCMVSFFLNGKINASITEIVAMAMLFLIKGLASGIIKKQSYGGNAVLSAFVYLACGITVSLVTDFSLSLLFAILFRSVLCGIVSYFLIMVISEFKQNGRIVITGTDSMKTAVIYILLICALCTVHFGYFNFGRAAGIFIILAICSKYGAAYGAAVGALTSFGILLSSYDLSKSTVLLVCTGLLAGAFSCHGKLKSAAVFIASNMLGAVVTGIPSGSLNLMCDVILASLVFVLIPENLYLKYIGNCTKKMSGSLKLFSDRMMFASLGLSDVRNTVLKASEALNRGGDAEKSDISKKVCSKVCSECRNSAFCGNDDKHRAENYFLPLQKIIEVKGFVTENDMPPILDNCTKKALLAAEFNSAYRSFKLEKRHDGTSNKMRDVTLEELAASEEMFKTFSDNIELMPYYDEFLSDAVKKYIDSLSVKNVSSAVFFDDDNHIYIECYYEGLLSIPIEKIVGKLSDITDRDLDNPEIFTIGNTTRICLHESVQFLAEVGKCKKNGSEDISGDADNIFSDGFGKMYFIMSDGMGSGGRAAVESCMAVSLLTRMLKSGIGLSAAVKLINLLLLTKSSDEIFATIDLLCLNLFSGKVDIIKLGAAQTFVKTGGTVKNVESYSMPVGIVSSVEFEKRSAKLSDDDGFVMITDGIDEDCYPRVRELMLSTGMTSQRVAEEIIDYSSMRKSAYFDDKTVFVVKLHKI